MVKIVVSYRRNDTKWLTHRICEHLEKRFGSGSIFLDIDNIPISSDFRDHIRQTLDACDILVAVIGPKWLERDVTGDIDNDADWVRLEISTALTRKIPVVPLLVDGTKMPKSRQLPVDLRELTYKQAAPFNSEDFRHQIQRFIGLLERLIETSLVLNSGRAANLARETAENPTPPSSMVSDDTQLSEKRTTPQAEEQAAKARPARVLEPIPASGELSEQVSSRESLNVRLRWFALIGGICATLIATIYYLMPADDQLHKIPSDPSVPQIRYDPRAPPLQDEILKPGFGLPNNTSSSVAVANPAKPEASAPNASSAGTSLDLSNSENIPFGLELARAKASFTDAEELTCWSGDFRGSAMRLTKDLSGTTLYFNEVWGNGLNLIVWDASSTNSVLGVHLNDTKNKVENLLGHLQEPKPSVGTYVQNGVYFRFDYDAGGRVHKIWKSESRQGIGTSLDKFGCR